MPRKIVNYGIFVLITAALAIAGYTYWLHQKYYPSTDDAQIEAHIINIATQITGKVQNIYVKNQETVKKNQLLFTIDPKPFEIAVQKAQANLQNTQQQILVDQNAVNAAIAVVAQRQAELMDAQKNDKRIMTLVKQGYYSKSGGDTTTRELLVAKQALKAAQDNLLMNKARLGKSGDANAQIQAANAALSEAQLNLQYTKIVAPENGQLAQFTLRPGQTVTAYEFLFTLVGNNSWWAIANLKETNLNRVRVGQRAVIHVDMYPSHPFHGIVRSISAGSGSSFSLLPAENATGNWVKVTQRFPVHVEIQSLDSKFPLRIGASCTVTIDTHE